MYHSQANATKPDLVACVGQRLGLDSRIDELSIIHVAGTKGKVSACWLTK